jgi:hypothetical protein
MIFDLEIDEIDMNADDEPPISKKVAEMLKGWKFRRDPPPANNTEVLRSLPDSPGAAFYLRNLPPPPTDYHKEVSREQLSPRWQMPKRYW